MAIEYLNDFSMSKEKLARACAKQSGRTTGLQAILSAVEPCRTTGLQAILSAVEPCRTFFVRKNAGTGMLELQNRPGKCLHYYHYWQDEKLGPCHVRLQTWFPFNVFVCVNGRDMLAGQMESLATVSSDRKLGELTSAVCRRTRWQGRGIRALNLLSEVDLRLLRAVGQGEFLVNGFRNRDIRVLLFDRQAKNEEEAKQQSGVVTRMLRLLRAHGVIRKVSGTHRYQVTERGRELIAGLTLAYDANPLKLQTAA